MRLPGADELFRPTTTSPPADESAHDGEHITDRSVPADRSAPADRSVPGVTSKPSRRAKHDSKVTVYMTSDELLDLEHARLALRRDLGQTLDRGRLIREAVAMALADYDEHGLDGELARRLGAS